LDIGAAATIEAVSASGATCGQRLFAAVAAAARVAHATPSTCKTIIAKQTDVGKQIIAHWFVE